MGSLRRCGQRTWLQAKTGADWRETRNIKKAGVLLRQILESQDSKSY